MEFPFFAPTLSSGKEAESNPNVCLCLVVTPNENQSLFPWHIVISEGVLTYEALWVPTAVHLNALHLENLMSYLIFFSFSLLSDCQLPLSDSAIFACVASF